MISVKRLTQPSVIAVMALLASMTDSVAASNEKIISDIDLSAAFSTRSPWRFTASQGPSGPAGDDSNAPGEIEICLRKTLSDACDPQLQSLLDTSIDLYSHPRYLNKAQVVQGASGRPYLWIRTSSLRTGDGDQDVLTQVLAYQPDSDRFVRVYAHMTGKNNNQTVRFIEKGALKGHIVSVEPTDNAPFGYWMSVNAPGPDGMYKEILRYRSATTYNDGNPLSTVDSEMANIQKRLGLWKAGDPLPLPERDCPKPHLIRMELWCN